MPPAAASAAVDRGGRRSRGRGHLCRLRCRSRCRRGCCCRGRCRGWPGPCGMPGATPRARPDQMTRPGRTHASGRDSRGEWAPAMHGHLVPARQGGEAGPRRLRPAAGRPPAHRMWVRRDATTSCAGTCACSAVLQRASCAPVRHPTCPAFGRAQTAPPGLPMVCLLRRARAVGTSGARLASRRQESSMDLSVTAPAEDLARTRGLRGSLSDGTRSINSAVSWGAITAGAAAAAFDLRHPDHR